MDYRTAPKTVPTSIEKRPNDHSFVTISLGNSYQQRIGAGIGQGLLSWDVRWDYLTKAEADSWRTFLRAHKGHELFHVWLDDESEPYLVFCDFWQEISLGRGFWTFTARLTTP